MTTAKFTLAALAAAAAMLGGLASAEAKSARCYTTDDGYYDCNFKSTDRNGSFMIWARRHPTFTIEMDSPGVAYGYADYGGGNVSLPGTFYRNQSDGACWDNSATGTQICAW
jgi:hypothetical protein